LGTLAVWVKDDVEEFEDAQETSEKTEPASDPEELPDEFESCDRRGERWCP